MKPLWRANILQRSALIADFGLYWAHRLAHKTPLLWRFHVVDTLISIALSQPLLFLAVAPIEVFQWTCITTTYVGMLTHSNVDMAFGPLSYVVSTAELHRWHYSTALREGNRNDGENLMIFDQMFGTYFNRRRRPPLVIGIREPMPASFHGQFAQPSRRRTRLAPETSANISATIARM